jgi:hypothetical protein
MMRLERLRHGVFDERKLTGGVVDVELSRSLECLDESGFSTLEHFGWDSLPGRDSFALKSRHGSRSYGDPCGGAGPSTDDFQDDHMRSHLMMMYGR